MPVFPHASDICTVAEESPLVSLLRLVYRLPLFPLPGGRGWPYVYGKPLAVNTLVVVLLRRPPAMDSLLAVLADFAAGVYSTFTFC
jgi:hypothetical protein